jgi:hypothetical protein
MNSLSANKMRCIVDDEVMEFFIYKISLSPECIYIIFFCYQNPSHTIKTSSQKVLP